MIKRETKDQIAELVDNIELLTESINYLSGSIDDVVRAMQEKEQSGTHNK